MLDPEIVWEDGNEWIRTSYANGVSEVTTNLSPPYDPEEENPKPWDVAIHTLTSFILSQFSVGVNVRTAQYREAIQTTIDALINNYGDN